VSGLSQPAAPNKKLGKVLSPGPSAKVSGKEDIRLDIIERLKFDYLYDPD
jgi:hypothetical protein